jgi:hypothetical protein
MSSGPGRRLRPCTRPDICQHLSSLVYQFNRPLASAAGPYILQNSECIRARLVLSRVSPLHRIRIMV